MASAQWLYHRVWCGALPLFHLPSQDEAASEQQLSQSCFATLEFFELRMQIRLKLTEAPPITHTRPAAVSSTGSDLFTAILSLLEHYSSYLLALERVTSRSSTLVVQLPTPLFHGLAGINLGLEATASSLPVTRWLTVEKTLVRLVMAQLHAVQAENRAARGLRLQDERTLARAELEWVSAQRLACLSAKEADNTADTEESVHTVDTLLKTAREFARALAHLCALRQIATRLSSLTLVTEQSERLARLVSAFARRALQLARDAVASLEASSLDDELSRQMRWSLEADAVRWKAVYIHCEHSIFQLDANPELALLYTEVLLTLKLPVVPSYSRRDSSFFTRIIQELQLLHSAQMTRALDDKKTLLRVCQQRFGPSWTPLDLDKAKLLALEVSMETSPPDLAAKLPSWDAVVASAVSESANELTDTTKLEAAITRSLEQTHKNLTGLPVDRESDASSTTDVSLIAVGADHSQRQEQADTSSRLHTRQVPAPALQSNKHTLNKLPPRPSSAQPSLPTPTADAVDSRAWVTIQHAGKALHFEKTLPRETAEDRVAARRNAVPLADVDGPQDSSSSKGSQSVNRLDRLAVLKRPASSPSYLSPAKPGDATASISRHTVTQRMWTPTRFSCALCEQRFMRCNLPGVAVMKRVFDLRNKWGVVLHAAKKLAAPSALYAQAHVCLLCQEILQFDDSSSTDVCNPDTSSTSGHLMQSPSSEGDAVGLMIYNAITRQWSQQQHSQQYSDGRAGTGGDKQLHLVDVAQRKRARQSSTARSMAAQYAVQPDSERCSHTTEERQPWWEVDLANYVVAHSVKLYVRPEASHLYSSASTSPARRPQQSGVFPLHIAVSMKSGVGRDLDDVLASSVTSHKFEYSDAATVGAGAVLVEWLLPPNARGRFVRVQSERVAQLHIERVHVFVVEIPLSLSLLAEAGANSDARRRKLQRAAFRASVIARSSTGPSDGATPATADVSGLQDRRKQRSSAGGSMLLSSLLDQPEQAEKKRLSKLYNRFRSLLEQRSRYDAHEAKDEEGKTETTALSKPTGVHFE